MESIFFWLSKSVWLVLSPETLFLVLIIVSWLLLWRGAYEAGQWLLGIGVFCLLFISLLPVGEWILSPLETRFPVNPELPAQIDGIIVLSGAEDTVLSMLWDQTELGNSAERDLAFLALAKKYPQARLLFTGGTGSMTDQRYKGADIARKLFFDQGLDTSRVVFERESRNTYESVVLSKEEMKPVAGENWILITSSYHMPRSVGIFCRAGWKVIPFPVDHWTMSGHLVRFTFDLLGNFSKLKLGMREWLGLFAYYLTGKTTALLPDSC